MHSHAMLKEQTVLQEIQAKLDNVPRRLRNSRAATGESVLRPLCRETVRPHQLSLSHTLGPKREHAQSPCSLPCKHLCHALHRQLACCTPSFRSHQCQVP